jgi:repressor LexA
MIGTVTAGQPILATENIEGYFPLLSEDMPRGETFMLKVKGESMINVGIYDGDQIIVKRQPTADNGDIVVALIDDSATVKTYYKEDGHFRLQPENDTMDPIIVPDLTILGKVVGLFRRYL